MADVVGTYNMHQWEQHGLSSGVVEILPWGGALWKRLHLQPFNVVNPTAPIPDDCQIWPQYSIAQSGDPTL